MRPNHVHPVSTWLRRLTGVNRALASATSPEQVLTRSVSLAAKLLRADRSVIVLPDGEGVLEVAAARGVDAPASARFRDAYDAPLLIRLETLFGPGARERLLAAPIRVAGRIDGLLAVDRRPEAAVDDEDWLFSALAGQVSIALENARAEQARARLERELSDVQAEAERALDVAKHDVRTPLNAIIGYLDLLVTGGFGSLSARQLEVLERVRGASSHLQAVLEDALERHQGRRRQPAMQRLAAAAVVREAVSLIAPAADIKRISLRLDLDEKIGVRCSRDRFRQVLVHVLDNAVKYCPSGTEVRIAETLCQQDGRSWCDIAVVDQGPGIPTDQTDAVFEPGRRLAPQHHDPGGDGLGLFIARSIVHGMGGRIFIDPGAGAGTTVHIRIPLADPVESASAGLH